MTRKSHAKALTFRQFCCIMMMLGIISLALLYYIYFFLLKIVFCKNAQIFVYVFVHV